MGPALVTISTDQAPAPGGHYAQATVAGGFLYVSGQLPLQPDGRTPVDLSFEAQARQALANMLAIVEAAGLAHDALVRVTAYIVGIGHWAAFNTVFAEAIPHWQPARSVVPVPELHHGFLIEIEAIAFSVN